MPFVSIIIPVYNSQLYLEKSIQSAIDQTHKDKEIIIIDDGSKDNSLEIAQQYERQGVIVRSQQNRGASSARNAGLAIAKGDFIQFLDADDFLRNDKISRQLSMLNCQNEVAICKTVYFFEQTKTQLADTDHFFQNYLNDPLRFLVKLYGGFDYCSGMIQPNAFLTHRSIIEKAGPWNEHLSLDDDGEYFCRVLLASKRIVYTPEKMNFYRKQQESISLSGSKSETAYCSQFNSIKLKHEHLIVFNHDKNLEPHIHTATYKACALLMHAVYPKYKELYRAISNFSDSLIRHSSRGKEVFGGSVANFIGNHISWKLLKHLQSLKTSFVR